MFGFCKRWSFLLILIGVTLSAQAATLERDSATETVYDADSKLHWQDDSAASTEQFRWEEASSHCDSLSVGGYEDWRLPTLSELRSIVDTMYSNPSIKLIFQNGVGGYYWTSTADTTESSYLGINFNYGSEYTSNITLLSYARCVRSSATKPFSADESALTRDDSSDTVTDTANGLMWQDDTGAATVEKPWVIEGYSEAQEFFNTSGDTATTYCDYLALGGYTNWRLPTITELESIVDKSVSTAPYINPVFQNTGEGYYFSSTTREKYDYYVYTVWFSSDGGTHYSQKRDSHRVRCVRSLDGSGGTQTVFTDNGTAVISADETQDETGLDVTVLNTQFTDNEGNEVTSSITAEKGVSVSQDGEGNQILAAENTTAIQSPEGDFSIIKGSGEEQVTLNISRGAENTVNADGSTESSIQTDVAEIKVLADKAGGVQALVKTASKNVVQKVPVESKNVQASTESKNDYESSIAGKIVVSFGTSDAAKSRALSSDDLFALSNQFESSRNFTVFERDIETEATVQTITVQPAEDSVFQDTVTTEGERSILLMSGAAELVVDSESITMDTETLYQVPADEVAQSDTLSPYADSVLALDSGWNLLALPIDQNVSDITVQIGVYEVAWKYSSSGWEKNPKALETGSGLWMKLSSASSAQLSGYGYATETAALDSGWHLLGTGKDISSPTANLDLQESWKYYQGTWSKDPLYIYRGQGFWGKK